MALEAPLRASTGNLMSSLSSFRDMLVHIPLSSNHPIYIPISLTSCTWLLLPLLQDLTAISSFRSTPSPADSQMLRPMTYTRPHSAHLLSPSSDIVGPSPVTSNGTETTEIDDEEQETVSQPVTASETDSPRQVRLPEIWITRSSTDSMEATKNAQDEHSRPYTESFE